jgi:hypothetical protein
MGAPSANTIRLFFLGTGFRQPPSLLLSIRCKRMKHLKILHLLSNWKWTEVSEPAVELALAQKELGAEIEFVCGRGPADRAKRRVDYHARKKKLNSIHVLDMPKHFKILSAIRDCATLHPMLKRFKPDVIHCHKKNAQLMRVLSRGVSKSPLIVRGCYDSEAPTVMSDPD